MATLIGASGQVLASPGCTSLNVGDVGSGAGVARGTGFDANDIITVSVYPISGFPTTPQLGASGNLVATGAITTTVAALLAGQNLNLPLNTLLITLDVGGQQNVFPLANITCTPAPTGAPTDSQNLRNLQLIGTQIVANQSGAAITGAVNGAIADAFSPTGGAPITGGPNGFTANFAAEPQPSEATKRTADAFAALGYAKSPSYNTPYLKAPPRLMPEWSAWLDVRGSGFDRGLNTNPTDIHAQQINVTGGVGRKINPDFLVGIFSGYENARVTMNAINGKLNADGGTIGGYTAWRFAPNWRIDALGGWSGMNYNANAGTASGSFSGSRFIGAGGLTGTYKFAGMIFEPSSNVYVLTEREGSWTDSLGTLQAARTFTVGRVASGAKLAAVPYSFTGDIQVSPYIGFYGDWRFSTDNALPVAVTLVGINNGWSGRAIGGFAFTSASGASIALGGEYGGIGAPYKIWTGTVRGSVPF